MTEGLQFRRNDLQVCLNSINRDYRQYPQPNNFTLDLKGRYALHQALLTSAELHTYQNTVEAGWCRFVAGTGFNLWTAAERTMTLSVDGGVTTQNVVLPARALPVVVSGDGTWTAPGPHWLTSALQGLLSPRVCYLDPVLLVVVCPPVTGISGTAAVVTGTPPPVGTHGLLVCGGAVLVEGCQALQALLQQCLLDQGLVGYTVTMGPRHLRFMGPGVVLVNPTAQLPVRLGFVNAGTALQTTAQLPLLAGYSQLPGMAARVLPTGAYSANLLAQAVWQVLNPLATFSALSPGPGNIQLVAQTGGLTSTLSGSLLANLPGGNIYHPAKLASLLAGALIDPTAQGIVQNAQVVWDGQAFCLTTQYPTILVLGSQFVPMFGWPAVSLPQSVHQGVPPLGGCFQDLCDVMLPTVIETGVTPSQTRRLIFQSRARYLSSSSAVLSTLPQDSLLLSAIGQGPARVTYTVVNGQATPQLISIPEGAPLPVAWTSYLPVVPTGGAGPLSLYFEPPAGAHWCHLAEVLGFPQGLTELVPPQTYLEAPYALDLDHPPYVLLELGLENMSTCLLHRVGEDLKTNLFGKIPTFCPYRWERGLPLQKAGTGTTTVSQLHIRVFNPWHQLYEFNGHNWSITLQLTAPVATTRVLEC